MFRYSRCTKLLRSPKGSLGNATCGTATLLVRGASYAWRHVAATRTGARACSAASCRKRAHSAAAKGRAARVSAGSVEIAGKLRSMSSDRGGARSATGDAQHAVVGRSARCDPSVAPKRATRAGREKRVSSPTCANTVVYSREYLGQRECRDGLGQTFLSG